MLDRIIIGGAEGNNHAIGSNRLLHTNGSMKARNVVLGYDSRLFPAEDRPNVLVEVDPEQVRADFLKVGFSVVGDVSVEDITDRFRPPSGRAVCGRIGSKFNLGE